MSKFSLSADDEKTHLPSDDTNFNESVYVNCFDERSHCGVWMRLGNRVNEGYAELSVCAYLPDGRVACQFQRPGITSNEGFDAGGLSYTVNKPLSSVSMTYGGEFLLLDDPEVLRDPRRAFADAPKVSGEITLDFDSRSGLHGGAPTTSDQETMYGRDFSLGHFYQHGVLSGGLNIDGQPIELNGFGWRDHSWGPRYWTNINYYRLLIASFSADRGFTVLKITDRNGRVRRTGSLLYDGRLEEIADIDLITDWTREKDPSAIHMQLKTSSRSVMIRGEVLTLAPLRNRRKDGEEVLTSRIAEGFTRWWWDEESTLGICEYIERLEDGEPVGYPQ